MSDDKRQVPGDFEIVRCDLPAFVGDYRQLDYGDPRAERTVQVRQEYSLEEVVGGYDTEFAAQCALKRWVRARWDHGWSLKFGEMQDALDILRAAERGEKFNCGFYSRVFVECARALGWVARLVGLAIRDNAFPRGHNVGNVGHNVPEIWSNQYRKWIVLDPDLNVHYEREGVPQSALELHDAWLAQEGEAVHLVQEDPPFRLPSGPDVALVKQLMPHLEHFDEAAAGHICRRFTRYNVLDYYARLSVGQFTWLDPRCLPGFVSHFAPASTRLLTSNPDDLYWTVNMARVRAAGSWADGPRLVLGFEHCMPWFDHYEARLDGGEWQPTAESFTWLLHEGMNVLEFRPVNLCARAGITSRLEVAFAAAIP